MTIENASQISPAAATQFEEILHHTGLMKGLPDDLRARITALGIVEILPRGSQLVCQGRPEDRLFVVLSRTLAVSRHRLGNRTQVGVLRKGSTIGAMHLIDPHPASADIVVVDGPATVWSVPDAEMHALLIPDSATGFLILRALARQICRRTRHDRNSLWRHHEPSQVFFRNMDL